MKYLLAGLITVAALALSPTAAQAATTSLPTCAEFSVFGDPGGDVAWQIPSVSHFDGNTNCMLGQGNQGAGVLVLQDALIRCYGQQISGDARFGTQTRDAVRNVQAFHRPPIDGVYGPQTKSAMVFPNYRNGRYAYCW